jgi:hypothetical protein
MLGQPVRQALPPMGIRRYHLQSYLGHDCLRLEARSVLQLGGVLLRLDRRDGERSKQS